MHETRHTFASFMIAAMVTAGRVNIKAPSEYMGHSKVGVTQDLYGHLTARPRERARGHARRVPDAREHRGADRAARRRVRGTERLPAPEPIEAGVYAPGCA